MAKVEVAAAKAAAIPINATSRRCARRCPQMANLYAPEQSVARALRIDNRIGNETDCAGVQKATWLPSVSFAVGSWTRLTVSLTLLPQVRPRLDPHALAPIIEQAVVLSSSRNCGRAESTRSPSDFRRRNCWSRCAADWKAPPRCARRGRSTSTERHSHGLLPAAVATENIPEFWPYQNMLVMGAMPSISTGAWK